ncbi:MAG: hypothetical protein P8X67_09925 [Syntrophobacterales bacterium]
MKKAIVYGLIVGVILMFSSPVTAKKEFGSVPATEILSFSDEGETVCFNWTAVDMATKYSLDALFEVDTDSDGEADMTVELSFGTGDYMDDMQAPGICIPKSDFYYVNDLDETVLLSGEGLAKVKGLNPGKGKGRQNNQFSPLYPFTLVQPNG